jgi:hypothetical protein
MTSRFFASTLAASVLLIGACGDTVLGSGATTAATATPSTSTSSSTSTAATTGSGGSGGSTAAGGSGGATTATGGGGATTAGGGGATTTTGGGGGGSPPVDCDALAAALAASIGPTDACTLVVRVAYATKQPIGFALVCGPHKTFTVEEAKALVESEQLYGNEDPWTGNKTTVVVSPPYPGAPDELVFFAEPGDFGGEAALSADTELQVFGGGIWWGGTGDVVFPTSQSLRPTEELGVGCFAAGVARPKVRVMAPDESAAHLADLSDPVIASAFDVAWHSAAASALGKSLSFGDSMVLFYAPSLGDELSGLPLGFDPASAEYVVFLNAR